MASTFLPYFRGLIEKDCDITLELKNDLEITGKIKFIDENMCIFLQEISIKDAEKYPQLKALKSIYVRGSTIRHIHLPFDEGEVEVLTENCKKAKAT